jgi:hypothetical protein
VQQLRISLIAFLASVLCLLPSSAMAQQALVVKPLAEKKVAELPAGPLFWRLENFPSLANAQAAAGPTGLAAESAGKVAFIDGGGSVNLVSLGGTLNPQLRGSY